MNCTLCQDISWVCEAHPDKPMDHDRCTDDAMPCPVCNPSSRGKVPILSADFQVDVAVGGANPFSSDDWVINLLGRVRRKLWNK